MERRDFIKHTAAIASVSAVGGIVEARPVPALKQHVQSLVGIVLVDERFSDSKQFASVYAAHGAKVISLEQDIGRLWYGELRDHCLVPGAVIAGLTLHTDLFVSEQFARECRKTWIPFGTHDCRGRRTLTHTLPATAELDLRERDAWAEHIARFMLNSCQAGGQTVKQSTRVARSSDHPGSLYSWMIV